MHQAFLELVRFSRAKSGSPKPELDRKHFEQCTEVVKHVPVYRLERPNSFEALPELIHLVEEELLR